MTSPRPGRASRDIYRATRHFGSLDVLRCLAVIPVVWHHASSGAVDGALGRGPLGVFALALPLCVGLATLSHHGFEARFLRLRERFQAQRAPVSPPGT